MPGIESIVALLKPHALKAAQNSYSPYSRFPVGAAVIAQDGKIYRGCNVENASFGLTQCAERSALTAAVSAGAQPGTLKTLLIYTPGDVAHPPCGACRQVMHELMSEDSLVVSCCDGAERKSWGPAAYLPEPFVPDALLK
jgi:cytidine deaminase